MMDNYFERLDKNIDKLLATGLTEVQVEAVLSLVKDASEEVLESHNRADRAETEVSIMKKKLDTLCLSNMETVGGIH